MSRQQGAGTLMPIGGAEEKVRNREVLRRFTEVCGADSARIVIIPTASRLDSTGPRYEEVFLDMGVAAARSLPIETRADCQQDEYLHALDEADGVFMTGGNQLRLSTTLGGTPFAKRLLERHGEGMHVAGTSAGAAILAEHMIAFGDEGSTPRCDMVTLAPGLGLTHGFIIDQHFRQRDRLGRLLTALSYNPSFVGIGLDEDTSAVIDGQRLEVCGTGAITVVDTHEISFSSMDSSQQHDPICVTDVRLHVLISGSSYDLETRQARPPRT
ncbi:MAG: cyanophycinase [Planctomycetota bacterium]